MLFFCLFHLGYAYLHLLSPLLEVYVQLDASLNITDDSLTDQLNTSYSTLEILLKNGNTASLERPGREVSGRTRSRQPLPFKKGDYMVHSPLSSKERRQQTGYTEVWAVPTKMPKSAEPQAEKQGILTAVISSLLGPGTVLLLGKNKQILG